MFSRSDWRHEWVSLAPCRADDDFIRSCVLLSGVLTPHNRLGWTIVELNSLRRSAALRPVARPQLITRSSRLTCESLWSAFVLSQWHEDCRGLFSDPPNRLYPPCLWCGRCCTTVCQSCDTGLLGRPLCWRCGELYGERCRVCFLEEADGGPDDATWDPP